MPPTDVVVVGDLVTDVLAVHDGPLAPGSDTPARIEITGGGAAANTAAWLAALGVGVTFVGVVGADAAGAARVDELRAAGVRCAVRQTTAARTGSVVVLSAGGERTMLVDRAANAALTGADVVAAVGGARHLHLSGYTLLDPATRAAGSAALAAAAAQDATTSVDAASAAPLRLVGGAAFLRWIRATTILFANLDEAGALFDSPVDAAEPLAAGLAAEPLAARLARSVANAVVKRGADGSVWAGPAGVVTAPAAPATVVDGTGAGDAFAAGALAAWLDGARPADALAAGARVAAGALAVVGARPTAPRR